MGPPSLPQARGLLLLYNLLHRHIPHDHDKKELFIVFFHLLASNIHRLSNACSWTVSNPHAPLPKRIGIEHWLLLKTTPLRYYQKCSGGSILGEGRAENARYGRVEENALVAPRLLLAFHF